MGAAAVFGVLAAGAISNTGYSNVTGNLGVDPSATVTGFPPGVVTQTIYKDDSTALQAKNSLASAYAALASDSCTGDLTGHNLGGVTLAPGVYCYSSAASLSGTLTLNSAGNPDALYIFQIAGSLTTSSSSSVVMTDGNGCNVFWQIGGSAVLGTKTAFAGSILSVGSITMGTGANVTGAAMTQDGSVVLSTNHIASQCSIKYYDQVMTTVPTGIGCFYSTYPVEAWVETQCSTSPPNAPATVGNGYDYTAYVSGSTNIGYATTTFSTASGITGENDSVSGPDYYSLQINTNHFSCTVPSVGGTWNDCWEQFLFDNYGVAGGSIYIQYQLLGYLNSYVTCPTASWSSYSQTCYINSSMTANTGAITPTNAHLAALEFTGEANYGSSGTDLADICTGGGTCWQASQSDTYLQLYQSWNTSEFNIFGLENYSQANFSPTPGVIIDPEQALLSDGAGTLYPTCNGPSGAGYTGETNNLSIVSNSCSVNSYLLGFSEGS